MGAMKTVGVSVSVHPAFVLAAAVVRLAYHQAFDVVDRLVLVHAAVAPVGRLVRARRRRLCWKNAVPYC
jgi:hypothetical protein